MADLEVELSHTLSDMMTKLENPLVYFLEGDRILFSSCKWNVRGDKCAKIVAEATDAGQCYTFNRDEENVLITQQTGSLIYDNNNINFNS
jgi:hypothetical protein